MKVMFYRPYVHWYGSLRDLIAQLEPAFVATRYDEVLLIAGLTLDDEYKYDLVIAPEDRAQLENEVTMHIELQRDFAPAVQKNPETLLQNKGAQRLAKELDLHIDTSCLQTYEQEPIFVEI